MRLDWSSASRREENPARRPTRDQYALVSAGSGTISRSAETRSKAVSWASRSCANASSAVSSAESHWLAVAVASNEVERQGINAWKRKRLIQAGADLIIGDYRAVDPLLNLIGVAS